MLKKTQQSVAAIGAPAQNVANSVNKIGAAAKQTQTFMDKLVSSFGRIAVFSVAAGLIVRGFFAITSALQNAVKEGIRFNIAMEQSKLAMAAILASTRRLATDQGDAVSVAASYPTFLRKAAGFQREILLLNIETLGTAEELQGVFQKVLAFSAQQVATDQERLLLSQNLLNAGKLLGLSGEQLNVETRQILTLENQRGQLILQSLGLTVQQLRAYKEQGTLVQVLNERLIAFSVIAKDLALTWEGLVTTASTFVSIISGAAFEGTFTGLKQVIRGFADELRAIEAAGGLLVPIGLTETELKELGGLFADFTARIITTLAEITNGFIKFLSSIRPVLRAAGEAVSAFADIVRGLLLPVSGLAKGIDLLAQALGLIPGVASGASRELGSLISKIEGSAVLGALIGLRVGGLGGAAVGGILGAAGGATVDALRKIKTSIDDIFKAGTFEKFEEGTELVREALFKLAKEQPANAQELELLLSILDRLGKQIDRLKESVTALPSGEQEQALATISALTTLLTALGSKFEAAKPKIDEVNKAIKTMIDSLNRQLIALRAERAELSLGTEAGLRIKLAKELATAATRNLAEAVITETLALEKEKKAIDDLEASYKELQSSLGEQSDFLNDTRQKLEDNIEVLEEQNRIVLDAIATGRDWEEVQVDLEVATERFRIAQEALAKGIPISTQALQGMAEKSVRLQHEFDKNKETAEVMSESFLFSFAEIQDVFDEVVRGIARGTSDLSDIFIRQGQALGASLITGILVGKSKLEGGIGKNFNQLLGLGPGGILGIFAQGGTNAAGAFFGTLLPDFQGIFGSLSAIGSNLFGGTAGIGANIATLFQSFGLIGAGAFGAGLAGGVKSIFGFGGSFEASLGGNIGAGIGAAIGTFIAPGLGTFIGSFLGDIVGSLFGDLFAGLPTKGTQIRQGVVKWLKDLDVSFAGQVKSGTYFFKTTKALADELGVGFLEASKIVLETEAGPEIAAQLQALGAFITAEAAKELGKPLEQTATTFGNMLVANLGIEAIPEAMAEIIEKAGITFEAVINSLNKAFEKGRISVEFYNDTIQGAIDLFLTDLPAALDVAAIAMQSFTDDGIFSMEIFEEKLEQAVENFTTIGEAAAQALTQGIEGGLSASEVGDLFEEILKAALREAAIAEFVEKFFEDLFKDIDLTKPFELSSAAMAELRDRVEEGSDALKEFLGALGLLPEVTRDWLGEVKEVIAASEKLSSVHKDILLNNEEFLDEWATGLQTVEDSLDSIEQTLQGLAGPIASTIIDAMLAGFTIDEATFVALVQGMVARAVLQGVIEGMIASFIIEPIIETIFAPIKEQIMGGLEAGLPFAVALSIALAAGAEAIAQIPDLIAEGIAIVVDFLDSPEMQEFLDFIAATPTFTAPDIPIDEPVEELAITVEDLADAVEAFVASVEGSEDPFQQLIDDYKELLALFEEFENQDVPESIVPPDVLLVQESLDLLAATMENLLLDLVDMQDEIESLTGIDIDPIISDIETLLEELAAGEIPSLESLQTLAEDLEALIIAAQLSGVDVNTIDTMKAAFDALEDVIAGFPVLEEDLALLADTLGLTEDELELLLEAHEAFVEGLSNEIDAINTTTSIFDDLTETLEEVRDAQEGIRQAFDEGLITLEEFTLLIKELAQATLVELVSELRALTKEIIDMVEEIQDTIGSIQEFIDAGEDLSDLESDLTDLTDEYEQALKDLRKEMLGVILSGESMGQMLEDVTSSFEAQAEAIVDAFIEEITAPATELLNEVGDSFIDLQSEANRLTDIALTGFGGMTDNAEEVLGQIDAAIDAQVTFIEKVRELQGAFSDLIDSLDDDIQTLVLEGMSLEEQIGFVGERAVGKIGDFFSQVAAEDFEKALETAEDARSAILQLFDLQKQLQQRILDDKIAELEATRDANIAELEAVRDANVAELEATRDANIEAINLQKDVRREQIEASIDFLDEQIRLQEDTNAEFLRQQEDAAQEQIRLQEETIQEQLRMIEDFRSAAEEIRRTIDQILLSDVSPLTPQARLDEARRQFEEVVTLARGGDTEAARRAGQLAQQFLGEASSFYASGAPFQAIFAQVIETLEELGIQFEEDAQLIQLEIISQVLGNVEGAIFISIDELIATRNVLQEELENLDDTFQVRIDEETRVFDEALTEQTEDFEDALAEQTEAFNDAVADATEAYKAAIVDARDQTLGRLDALRTGADVSLKTLQTVEETALAVLRYELVPAAEEIGTIMKNELIFAVNNPTWVDRLIEALRQVFPNIPSIPRAQFFSEPPPRSGFQPSINYSGSLVGISTPPPGYYLPPGVNVSEPGSFPAVTGALGPFLPLQGGGIVTRPVAGLLHPEEAVIPLRHVDSLFDIDYDKLGHAVAEAFSNNNNGPSQNNINIEVRTEDGETIVRRTIRTMSDESRSGKIFIDARGVGKYRRA